MRDSKWVTQGHKWRRWCIVIALVVLGAIFAGGVSLRVLRFLNASNPIQLAFLDSFWIVNQSGQYVEVMPIGITAGRGSYAPLPRYKNSFPPAMSLHLSETVDIAPHEKQLVTYDWDDINFRHLLIRDHSGRAYLLDTDKKGTREMCYGPQQEFYVIPPLAELRPAPLELLPCFSGEIVTWEGTRQYP